MAYDYDRYEREEGSGSFLMGLLAGTVLGAGLGMLFAPKAGSELRNQLSEQANRLRDTANDTYNQASEKVTQIVERGKDAYERARGAAGDAVTRGRESFGATGTAGTSTGATGTTSGGTSGGGYGTTGGGGFGS